MKTDKTLLLFILIHPVAALLLGLSLLLLPVVSPFFPVVKAPLFSEATLSITGDLMAHSAQLDAARSPDGFYSFDSVYQPVAGALSSSDCTIGNLETTVSTSELGYGGYPLFRTPESYIEALKDCGYDLLTTANNHSFDGGDVGVNLTINAIKNYGMAFTGTQKTEEHPKPLILPVNGIRVAHFAYTHSTNGNDWKMKGNGRNWRLTRVHETEKIRKQFAGAKAAGAELIIAHVHWGNEYQRQPDAQQRIWAGRLGELGADIIAGSHPHVLQPVEWIEVQRKGEKKRVLTAWSLGNFIAYMGHRFHAHSDTGMIWNIRIRKDLQSGEIEILSTDYLPVWVHVFKAKETEKLNFQILPLFPSAEMIPKDAFPLSKSAQKRYEAACSETFELMNKEWFIPTYQISQISE